MWIGYTKLDRKDKDMYPTNIEYMKENFDKFDINYKVLNIEETIGI